MILLCVLVPVFPFLLKPIIIAAVIILAGVLIGRTGRKEIVPDVNKTCEADVKRLSAAEQMLEKHRKKMLTDSALSENYRSNLK
ncbi:MAG: hypothetical protein IJJ34_02100 [Clostridia bacterium]|nr:hypothetical protein [Clostridia bacterium]